VVTGVAAGTATITVTTADGNKTASCAVTVTAASGGSTPGSITFTGIDSKYNGQYATFRSSGNTPPTGGIYLVGSTVSSSNMTITGARINGGSVTIPVYLVVNEKGTVSRYTGSDKSIKIVTIQS
jgi:uncharacterized protein YjdB